MLAPEVATVSLLDPEVETVSLQPEVAVVSLLVPEQTREVGLGPTPKPFFLGFPNPPELEWRGRGVKCRRTRCSSLKW